MPGMDSPLERYSPMSERRVKERSYRARHSEKLAHAQMVEKELDLERRNEIGAPEALPLGRRGG